MTETTQITTATVLRPDELLAHWQGHRALTRRVIEAFPEEAFFTHRIGGMRPFSEMCQELLQIAHAGIQEIATGKQATYGNGIDHGNRKAAFLARWDETTDLINTLWPDIQPEQFQAPFKAFGQWEGTVISTLLYYIDNEIHHRGQGYVYLRDLGITPPPFWERA